MFRQTCLPICVLSISFAGWASQPALAAGDATGEALAEIIVTAEKQTQNLQKTAAAVTAIPADVLIEAGVAGARGSDVARPDCDRE